MRRVPRLPSRCAVCGRDLTGQPWSERRQALTAICPAELLVDAVRTDDPDEAQRFVDRTLQAVGEDKSADQADTIGTVRRLHRRGSAAETIRRAEPG